MIHFLSIRLSRFLSALKGIVYMLKKEVNFKILGTFSIVIITVLFNKGITTLEWAMVVLCIAYWLTYEILNTAVEMLCDLISLKYDLRIKAIKDVAAGGVLLSLIFSILIFFLIIFQ